MKSRRDAYFETIDALPIKLVAERLYRNRLERYGLKIANDGVADWVLRKDKAGMFIPEQTPGLINCFWNLMRSGEFDREFIYQHHSYQSDHEPYCSMREAVVRWSLQLVLHRPREDNGQHVLECDLDGWNAHYKQGVLVPVMHGFHALRHRWGGRRTDLRKAAKWLYEHRNVEV